MRISSMVLLTGLAACLPPPAAQPGNTLPASGPAPSSEPIDLSSGLAPPGSTTAMPIDPSGQQSPIAPYPVAEPPTVVQPPAASVPPLKSFAFKAIEQKLLPGGSQAPVPACKGTISAEDSLGDVGVGAMFSQNYCYSDGQYNARDFAVIKGIVTASSGEQFEAYRFFAPKTDATSFLASKHQAFMKFAVAADHMVFALQDDAIVPLGKISARDITAGAFVQIPLELSPSMATTTIFAVPSSNEPSSWTTVAKNVKAGSFQMSGLGSGTIHRYHVGGTPSDLTAPRGSDAFRNRIFFPMTTAAKSLAIAWQDASTAKVIVTQIADGGLQFGQQVIDNPNGDQLAAAASDGNNHVFAFFVQKTDRNRLATRSARLVRVDLATGEQKQAAIDASEKGLNITKFDGDIASMQFANQRLLLIIGRTMHRSPDGLNHQGAIAVSFDPNTLAVITNFGQTSGHSFDNVLTHSSKDLIAIDLGDNYPRGIHFHDFSTKFPTSKVVYTFKTEHGQDPQSPAGATYPFYPEASGRTKRYKWSNDNSTYTTLGSVVETQNGYAVSFAGEMKDGHALDNSRASFPSPDPRNLGLVTLRKSLPEALRWGHEIPDQAMLTKGGSESGGFYSFNGDWTPQRNAGVVWLTNYSASSKRSVARVRTAVLGDGNLLTLWEEDDSKGYIGTFAVKTDEAGNRLANPISLGEKIRLGIREDILVRGNEITIVGGSQSEHAIVVTKIIVQ